MAIELGLSILAMPGVVVHELAHFLFCKLVGVRVHKTVFFQFGNPAGYVVHAVPARFADHVAIAVGPFVVNTAVALAVFRWSALTWISSPTGGPYDVGALLLPIAGLWWGVSVALQAFPSKGDAKNLWQAANARVRRGSLLAAVGYPIVAIIYVANILRIARVDLGYALILLVVAALL